MDHQGLPRPQEPLLPTHTQAQHRAMPQLATHTQVQPRGMPQPVTPIQGLVLHQSVPLQLIPIQVHPKLVPDHIQVPLNLVHQL